MLSAVGSELAVSEEQFFMATSAVVCLARAIRAGEEGRPTNATRRGKQINDFATWQATKSAAGQKRHIYHKDAHPAAENDSIQLFSVSATAGSPNPRFPGWNVSFPKLNTELGVKASFRALSRHSECVQNVFDSSRQCLKVVDSGVKSFHFITQVTQDWGREWWRKFHGVPWHE